MLNQVYIWKIILNRIEFEKINHFQTGIEDTDEEMNEKDSANGKKRKIEST